MGLWGDKCFGFQLRHQLAFKNAWLLYTCNQSAETLHREINKKRLALGPLRHCSKLSRGCTVYPSQVAFATKESQLPRMHLIYALGGGWHTFKIQRLSNYLVEVVMLIHKACEIKVCETGLSEKTIFGLTLSSPK